MALFLHTKPILAGEPNRGFNHDHDKRGFTDVDNIVRGMMGAPDLDCSGVAPQRT